MESLWTRLSLCQEGLVVTARLGQSDNLEIDPTIWRSICIDLANHTLNSTRLAVNRRDVVLPWQTIISGPLMGASNHLWEKMLVASIVCHGSSLSQRLEMCASSGGDSGRLYYFWVGSEHGGRKPQILRCGPAPQDVLPSNESRLVRIQNLRIGQISLVNAFYSRCEQGERSCRCWLLRAERAWRNYHDHVAG